MCPPSGSSLNHMHLEGELALKKPILANTGRPESHHLARSVKPEGKAPQASSERILLPVGFASLKPGFPPLRGELSPG